MTQPDCHDDLPALRTPAAHDPAPRTDAELLSLLIHAIRSSVGETNFSHWFHRRTRLEIDGDRLLVFVPNPFVVNWLLRRFRTALTKAAQQILGPSASCQLEVDGSLATTSVSASSLEGSPPPVAPDLCISDDFAPAVQSVTAADSTPMTGVARRTNKSIATTDGSAGPSGLAVASRRRFRGFDSFITGECNSLAALAARQVATKPGERYNPLFLYGGTGTGKTHLLEAIYSQIRATQPTKTVMYLTSEAFTNYFTSALSSRMVPGFRQRFRNVDVLLIDNIEFLDNKRATQEEFLHTIVQLIDHGGQVVVSSDRHPRMLTKHREELTTRFQSGLVCRIEAPDDETRRQIILSLSTGMKAVLCQDTLDYLVRRCRRNTREIQGALNQLESHVALTGRRVTLAVAREVLGELADECRRLVRISDVERVICEAFGVSASDLRSSSRRRLVALPRAIAMFLSRRLTKSAYREIGSYFGGRDHSTVVAAERRVADWVTSGEAIGLPTSCAGRTIAELIDELEQRLLALAT